jgi:hypothetical protein
LAGQTHVAMITAPDLFANEILAFLGAQLDNVSAESARHGGSSPSDAASHEGDVNAHHQHP